jgi:hypothetical protein
MELFGKRGSKTEKAPKEAPPEDEKPARRPIYEAAFEDEPDELTPEMAHAKAMKESERLKKTREQVCVKGRVLFLVRGGHRAHYVT